MTARRRVARALWCAAAWCAVAFVGAARSLAAQTVVIDGPPGPTLPTITPTLTVRANGFPLARPLRVTILVGSSPDFTSGVAVDTTLLSADSVVAVQITRPLPSDVQVFWKARVFTPAGVTVESAVIGPRGVPPWLTLVYPNSQAGDIVDIRQPLFVWKSARVAPALGEWSYDVDVFAQQRVEQTVSGLSDTTWRPISDLQSNTSYRWSVRASLKNGTSVTANSVATFVVKDQPFPSRTLIYQSFPNPFPSPSAFSACIWFDVAQPGARLSLDVTDLRGNLVRTLIPGSDGLRDFPPGQYGRGAPGAGSSCDNRFVWDGTGSDGRTVAPGVYLLRFQAGRQLPTFTRMLFLGR